MKRIIIILAIVLVVGGLLLGGYLLRKGGETSNEGDGNGGNLPPGLPPGGEPAPTSSQSQAPNLWRLKQVAATPVYDYFAKENGEVVILGVDGQVNQVRASGEVSSLSAAPIKDILKSAFAYDGEKAAIAFGEKSNPQVSVFDVKTKTWQPLDAETSAFDWAPGSYEMGYLTQKSDRWSLNTWNLGNSKAKAREVVELRVPDLDLSWTKSKRIVLVGQGSALLEGGWWNLDPETKNLTPISIDQLGLEILAQKNGDYALVFKSLGEGRGGGLFLLDQDGKTSRPLSFLTLPSKCAFEKDGVRATTTSPGGVSVICAIPEESLSPLTLPDDYQKRKLFTTDSFYRIDLQGGGIELIFSGSNLNLDAANLRAVGQRLYFVNRVDQKLYSITAP